MKGNKYILQIDNPCTQNLSGMEKTDAGRFCTHCSKAVIDFTRLSDKEIARMLDQSSDKLCGSLNKEQLNRIIADKNAKHSIPFYKVLAGLLAMGLTESAFSAQRKPDIEMISPIDSRDTAIKQSHQSDTIKNRISGRLVDAVTKEPITFTVVRIKDNIQGATSDAQGKFELTIPPNMMDDIITLVVSSIGSQSLEIFIQSKELPLSKDFHVMLIDTVSTRSGISETLPDISTLLVGKVGGISFTRKRWWQFWK